MISVEEQQSMFNLKKIKRRHCNEKKIKKIFLSVVFICSLFGSVFPSSQAKATCVGVCFACSTNDTIATPLYLELTEEFIWTPLLRKNIRDHIYSEVNWIVTDFYDDFWLPGVAELTEYLTAFGMYQMSMVGSLFDAKIHSETSRLFFKLQAEAHRDYHPSDDFCYFGTNARSLAASDSRARLNMLALSSRGLQRQIGYAYGASALSAGRDKKARWDQFTTTYCDPKDNGWMSAGSGLDFACDRDGPGGNTAAGAINRRRVNIDIDYTRLVETPRTIDFDFSDGNNSAAAMSDNEQDVLAMSANLYGHNVPLRRLTYSDLKNSSAAQKLYLELRSVAAKRSVAAHSFNKIVSLKSSGTNGNSPSSPNVRQYMAAVMKELMPASTPSDIVEIIGDNPSYYAQMEILTKKIYQNPKFFANLYDSPANIERKKVAMKALELMLDRELFESELRQEMLLSVMLSGELSTSFKKINGEFDNQ